MAAATMSEKDYAIFLAHLKKKAIDGVLPPCPICGSCEWAVSGPEGLVRYEAEGKQKVERSTFPVVTTLCPKCFFMHLFAWIPIENEAKKDG